MNRQISIVKWLLPLTNREYLRLSVNSLEETQNTFQIILNTKPSREGFNDGIVTAKYLNPQIIYRLGFVWQVSEIWISQNNLRKKMNREYIYWEVAPVLNATNRLNYFNLLKIYIPELRHGFYTVSDPKALSLLSEQIEIGYNYTESCENGYLDIVRYLVRLSPIFLSFDELNLAFQYHELPTAKFLLDNIPDEMLNTRALARTLANSPSLGMFRLLITRIPNLEDLLRQLTTDEVYSLFSYGSLPSVRFSIRHGVDPNQGLSPAAAYGQYDILKYLIEKGADPNFNHGIALKEAVLSKHVRVVELLLPLTSPEYIDDVLIQAVSRYQGFSSRANRMADPTNTVWMVLTRNPSREAIQRALVIARQLKLTETIRLLVEAESRT